MKLVFLAFCTLLNTMCLNSNNTNKIEKEYNYQNFVKSLNTKNSEELTNFIDFENLNNSSSNFLIVLNGEKLTKENLLKYFDNIFPEYSIVGFNLIDYDNIKPEYEKDNLNIRINNSKENIEFIMYYKDLLIDDYGEEINTEKQLIYIFSKEDFKLISINGAG